MDSVACKGDCTICPNLALYRHYILFTARAYLCSVEMYCSPLSQGKLNFQCSGFSSKAPSLQGRSSFAPVCFTVSGITLCFVVQQVSRFLFFHGHKSSHSHRAVCAVLFSYRISGKDQLIMFTALKDVNCFLSLCIVALIFILSLFLQFILQQTLHSLYNHRVCFFQQQQQLNCQPVLCPRDHSCFVGIKAAKLTVIDGAGTLIQRYKGITRLDCY